MPRGITVPLASTAAHVFQEEVDQYMSAGMAGFLGKPFSLGELADSIGRVAGGARSVVVSKGVTRELLLDDTIVGDDIQQLGVDKVRSIVELFGKSGEQLVQEIVQHASRGESKQAADIAHKMHGAASNFGLHKLCVLLAEIELRGNRGELNAATDTAYAQLHESFEGSLVDLRQLLLRHGDTSSSSAFVRR